MVKCPSGRTSSSASGPSLFEKRIKLRQTRGENRKVDQTVPETLRLARVLYGKAAAEGTSRSRGAYGTTR